MSKLFESKKKIIDLVKEKPMTMTQIAEKLNLGQSTTNQHLKELLKIGAIKEIENPYSRKWKYYEYNKGFEKHLEDNGYNIAKVRAFAIGIMVIVAIAAVGIFLLNNNAVSATLNQQYTTTPPSLSSYPNAGQSTGFVVQLTDPPIVPPDTTALVITYSSIGILHSNSSLFEYFNVTGTADLLNLTNATKTIAVLNTGNYSSITKIRMNISSAYITIGNSTFNVTVPQGYVMADLNSSANSSTAGALLNMNPTIVRIYSQSNASIFVMVPNVKAIFIGKSEVASAARTGYITRINPNITRRIRSNSSIEITNATLISSGNSTSISIGIRNTGNSSVMLNDVQLQGIMEEITLGYQSYMPEASVQISAGDSQKACGEALCENSKLSIFQNLSSVNQSELQVGAATAFLNKFNNYLNFIVLDNGTLSLPVLNYEPDCLEPQVLSSFIGCRPITGMKIKPGANVTLHLNSTLKILKRPFLPEAEATVFGGEIKILLVPNQTYGLTVSGYNDYQGTASAKYNTTDKGNITGYTKSLVGVSYVNEEIKQSNLSYNSTLQGFTSVAGGITNYTLPIQTEYGKFGSTYSLENISILTHGFALLSITNVTGYVPGTCPVCTGSIHCLVCIAGGNIREAILQIKAPDYGYYGPLNISVVYHIRQYTNTTINTTNTSDTSTITSATTTMPESNQSGYGTMEGNVKIGPLCPVESINGTCAGSIDLNSLYSELKLELTQINGLYNYTIPISANGSYSQQVDAGSYSVSMLNCHYIGCMYNLPKSVNVSAGETTNLNISIDTGIR